MTLRPLLDAVPPIPGHALVALTMLVLGAWQLAAGKGTWRHRIVGWLFVLGMTYVSLSAVFISEIELWGRFSPIHLLIPVTLVGLFFAVRDARRGDIEGHRRGMTMLFILALAVTGAFTLLPGRVMHDVIFADAGKAETR